MSLLTRIVDQEGAAIYCDPPYLVKGAKYTHDFEDDTHRELAEKLTRFNQARVVVSYYEHPRIDELYPPNQWTKVDCIMTKMMANQASGDPQKAPEILLINGPSYTANQDATLFQASGKGDA